MHLLWSDLGRGCEFACGLLGFGETVSAIPLICLNLDCGSGHADGINPHALGPIPSEGPQTWTNRGASQSAGFRSSADGLHLRPAGPLQSANHTSAGRRSDQMLKRSDSASLFGALGSHIQQADPTGSGSTITPQTKSPALRAPRAGPSGAPAGTPPPPKKPELRAAQACPRPAHPRL